MGKFLGGTFVVGLLILLVIMGPLILLASINTIFEEASMAYYIPHNVWTYLSCYGIMACLRGGKVNERPN